MMIVKGVIFDLDGTLIDTIEDISAAANLMLSSYGYPVHEVKDYLGWIGNGAARLIAEALPNGLEEEDLANLVKEFRTEYGENLHDRSRIYDGIPELLDFLKDSRIELSILSNKPHQLTQDVADYYLSEWPFRFVFGQRDHIPRKPDPAAAIEIASNLGIDPADILFVGDSKNDILTARAGGFIAAGVTWGYGSEDLVDIGADYLLQAPDDLIGLLSK